MQTPGPATTLHFAPWIDETGLIALGIAGAFLLAVSFLKFPRGAIWRGIVFALFMLTLAGPSLLREERVPVKDTAVIVVDQSPSQSTGDRTQRTEKALAAIAARLEKEPGLDILTVRAPEDSVLAKETRLFDALDLAFSGIPAQRRAGVIFLTDGQLHDVPDNTATFTQYGPVHALLSGEKNEKDRRLVIASAPAYGLVGKTVTISYRIEDTQNIGNKYATITLTSHDGTQQSFSVETGKDQSLTLPVDNPGQNVFELATDAIPGELTAANNRAALLVNGVRDRLKVLLVSGRPHAGGRTWRDLLTSDPGVDLIHFTILREPTKLDFTPQRDLALIPFPFRELFEVKLYDFDLIIFDRYNQNNILPDYYYENIVRYVRQGGAFLEASGPSFAGDSSIYTTPLKDVIPGAPTGKIYQTPYLPALTDQGKKHPVTAGLIWKSGVSEDNPYGWGRWQRQIEITPKSGDVLMSGAEDKPLLILDRVGEGRVAQIASDHIWLWSRGYEGGGPHAELLRRVVHWLMKEPELDERALDVAVDGDTITIRKQDYLGTGESVAMTTPDAETQILDLLPDGKGWLVKQVKADRLGIYAFEDTNGTRKYAIIGDLNPPELRDVTTTKDKLHPIVEASGGGILWLEDTPEPAVRLLSGAHRFAGGNWIGLRRNNDYIVKGVQDIPLLPAWLSLLILLCALTWAWWREGKKS